VVDGPLPAHSNRVLEILAAQCIKATFFTIGRMATGYPEGVRKLRDAGHTIGTHSQDHPLTMNTMPIERAKQQVDDGIASVKAALGDDAAALGPFFRIPGLLHGQVVRPPGMGAAVLSVDEEYIKGMPGAVKVVVKKNFVGVVAEKPWQALQAANKLKVAWTPGTGLPMHSGFSRTRSAGR